MHRGRPRSLYKSLRVLSRLYQPMVCGRGTSSSMPRVLVALFASFEGHGKPVLLGPQRAGGVRGVGTGRVVELIKVEHQGAPRSKAVIGKGGAQEPASLIRGGLAGGISEDEEE